MSFNTFSPNTQIKSADVNTNFTNIANGSEVGNVAWTSFTSTWSAVSSNPSLGNASMTSRYMKLGRSVTVSISLFMGSTTTFGSGAWQFSLPFACVQIGSAGQMIAAGAFQTSTNTYYPLYCRMDNTSTILRIGGAGQNPIDATHPFTWASSDILNIQGTYESTS